MSFTRRNCQYCLGCGYVEVRDYERGKSLRRPCPECSEEGRLTNYRYEEDQRRWAEEEYRFKKEQMMRYNTSPDYFVDPAAYFFPDQCQPPQPKEKTSMNYSTAVMLINEEIRAIACSYEPDLTNPDGTVRHQTTRKVYKTLDKTIKVGDFVVVGTTTRHNMTINKVEEVDVDVDFENGTQVFWAIAKVDTETVKAIKAKEGEWVAELKKVERKHQKEKLKEKVLGAYSVSDVKVLSFTGTHDASALAIEAKLVPTSDNTTSKT